MPYFHHFLSDISLATQNELNVHNANGHFPSPTAVNGHGGGGHHVGGGGHHVGGGNHHVGGGGNHYNPSLPTQSVNNGYPNGSANNGVLLHNNHNHQQIQHHQNLSTQQRPLNQSNSAALIGGVNQGQNRKINGLAMQVKSGYLLHHKKKLFGKAWKEEYVVLYEDSSIIWYRDREKVDQEGGLFLRDAPELLAAGQWTSRVPQKPEFPQGCDKRLSIAIGSRHSDKVHWFLCKSEAELIDWMSAINTILPPPPPPPDELRDSRRNLALLNTSNIEEAKSAALSALIAQQTAKQQRELQLKVMNEHQNGGNSKQPQDGDKFSKYIIDGLDRLNLHQTSTTTSTTPSSKNENRRITDSSRSYSAGRLTSVSVRPKDSTAALAAVTASAGGGGHRSGGGSPAKVVVGVPQKQFKNGLPSPMTRQMSFQEPSITKRDVGFSDLMAGVLIGGVLTQWNGGPECWDWGMGWGWTGWNAPFCGTCAMEQAVLANHGIGHHPPPLNSDPSAFLDMQDSSSHAAAANSQFYFDDDNDVAELGDTDVACDFGGDFGGF